MPEPELDPSAVVASPAGALHPISLAAARHGLLADPASPIPEPPDDAGWQRVMTESATHGLAGLLAAAHREGVIALTPSQAAMAADRALESAQAAVRIEAALLAAIDVLEPAGVVVRVGKGVACAHLDYPDPAWRAFNDVDVLVPDDDLDRAVAGLTAQGFLRDLPERRPGFDRRFGKDVELYGPGGVVVDVHRRFAHGAFGLWQVADDLWRATSPFGLGGRTVRALDPENRFLQACFSAMFGNALPRAGQLRDLVEVVTRTTVDVDEVRRRAEAWRCAAVVGAALDATAQVLGIRLAPGAFEWANAAAHGRDARVLRAYPNFGGSHGVAVLSGVLAAPGLRGRAAFVRAVAAPGREYRSARAAQGLGPEWRLFLRGIRRSALRWSSDHGA